MYALGEKIKLLRNEKRITQEALVENLNVSRSAIAKWETNSGVPEVSNLKIISKLFDVSVDELIDDTKGMKKMKLRIIKYLIVVNTKGNIIILS